MKVLLKKRSGTIYYAGAEGWSADRKKATIFSSVENAKAMAMQIECADAEILLEFPSVSTDVVVPIILDQPQRGLAA